MTVKTSYGIILTRINPSSKRVEAVMVRGRYTYQFAEFVHGLYSSRSERAIDNLIAGMVVEERILVYSLDFEKMWYHIWLDASCATTKTDLYQKKLARFTAMWMQDDGRRLRQKLQKAPEPPQAERGRWEFPKGKKKSPQEHDLDCAVREFNEETQIRKDDYALVPGYRRAVSHTHGRVRYATKYFLARARRELRLGVTMSSIMQVTEIAEIRWMDIEAIRFVDSPTKRLESIAAPSFRFAKRLTKNLTVPRPLAVPPGLPLGAPASTADRTADRAADHGASAVRSTIRNSDPE